MAMTRFSVAISLALAFAAGPALSQTSKDKPKAEAKAPAKAEPAEKGRDWTQIDTNKDGYISPEELDTWLKANPGPQK